MDDAYVSNQQQNITDAMNLLHRLATGIDVNVQFRKINDFEFTRECTIFDLLDIGLYHGWIVDPQDTDTATAIGSKSYNTLVGELVAFDTRKAEGEFNTIQGEDSVDFAAATTATLGVPSPSLSRGISFDDSPASDSVEQLRGKGDMEEETELMRALNLSRTEILSPINESRSSNYACSKSFLTSEGITGTKTESVFHVESSVAQIREESEKPQQSDLSEILDNFNKVGLYSKVLSTEHNFRSAGSTDTVVGSENLLSSDDLVEIGRSDTMMGDRRVTDQSTKEDGSRSNTCSDQMIFTGEDRAVTQSCTEESRTSQIHYVPRDKLIDCDFSVFPDTAAPIPNDPSSNERKETDALEVVTPSLEGTEPIYEGEEHILDSGHSLFVDREPVYEGEVVLAAQADKMEDAYSVNVKHDIKKTCQLVKTFLENNASQLTIYGLFCLQEGLKERELCVFFRNNHFSTMFKFNGELYLLATDQGYINQPDLVWEKLNEVNGDTVFMTGNLKEFKAENQVNDTWNEQSAMTSTADYLAILEGSSPSSDLNSDLQLAIALQQQEFEQQPERHQQRPSVNGRHQQQNQQPFVSGRSQLVTGPQRPRSSNSTQKSDSKSKDKCILM